MSQSIDLSAVTETTFNGSAVEQINLNGAGVWTMPATAPLYFPSAGTYAGGDSPSYVPFANGMLVTVSSARYSYYFSNGSSGTMGTGLFALIMLNDIIYLCWRVATATSTINSSSSLIYPSQITSGLHVHDPQNTGTITVSNYTPDGVYYKMGSLDSNFNFTKNSAMPETLTMVVQVMVGYDLTTVTSNVTFSWSGNNYQFVGNNGVGQANRNWFRDDGSASEGKGIFRSYAYPYIDKGVLDNTGVKLYYSPTSEQNYYPLVYWVKWSA